MSFIGMYIIYAENLLFLGLLQLLCTASVAHRVNRWVCGAPSRPLSESCVQGKSGVAGASLTLQSPAARMDPGAHRQLGVKLQQLSGCSTLHKPQYWGEWKGVIKLPLCPSLWSCIKHSRTGKSRHEFKYIGLSLL